MTVFFSAIIFAIFIIKSLAYFYKINGFPNTKKLILVLLSIWHFFYACLSPILYFLFNQSYPKEDIFYVISIFLLFFGYLVSLIFLLRFPIPAVNIDSLNSKILPYLILTLGFFMGFIQAYIAIYALILPSLFSIYLFKQFSSIEKFVTHIIVIFYLINIDYFLTSKEVIVLSTVGPILFSSILHSKTIFSLKIFLIASLAFITLMIFGPLVALYRIEGLNLAINFFNIDLYLNYLQNGLIERLFVIDMLTRIIELEFANKLASPTLPIWTYTGWIFAIFPSFFINPDHALEALQVSGYVTSSDEVNIAVTYIGHILWSYGFKLIIPGVILFWLIWYLFLSIALKLSPLFSILCTFSISISIIRLESLTVIVLGICFTSLILFAIMDLIFRSAKIRLKK